MSGISSTQAQQSISTTLDSGDKAGTSSVNIITHKDQTFNPNVKIVIDKNKSPVIDKDEKTKLDQIKDQLNDMLTSDKENHSTTFILIAGGIIVLIFMALFIAKLMLSKKVIRSAQRNAELVA